MSLHNSTHIHEAKDKTHRDRLHVDLVSSQHDIVLPKLPLKERGDTHRHKHDAESSNDSLFRIFKDQNTIDILRHKNINDFKHKAAYEKSEDIEVMMREIEEQKDEVIKEMKIWTRVSEAALKGEVKFSETDYSELHNCFYKWLLFIEESYTSYEKIENSLPPPLLHHSPNLHSTNHYNEDIIKRSPHARLSHSKVEKEEHQREVHKLNLIIGDLNSEVDLNKIKVQKLQYKVQELDGLLNEEKEVNLKYQQRAKQVNKRVFDVIAQSENFLFELKTNIVQGKDMKPFVQAIDHKINLLKKYKQSFK